MLQIPQAMHSNQQAFIPGTSEVLCSVGLLFLSLALLPPAPERRAELPPNCLNAAAFLAVVGESETMDSVAEGVLGPDKAKAVVEGVDRT